MEAAVLKTVADALFKFLSSEFVIKELHSIWKNDKEIESLAMTVDHIRNLLFDVQRKQIEDECVKEWYQRLRELFLDAEDFLDKVQTIKKKKEAKARRIEEAEEEIMKPGGEGKLSLAYACIKIEPLLNAARCFFSSSSNQAKYALEVHNAIKEIKENFNASARDIQSFPLQGKEPSSKSERALTAARARTCIVNATDIFGRDGDKEKIVELLLRPSVDERKISVVSIVGIGGIGKTTVAQLVYGDNSWQEKCRFDKKFWVSDSKKYDQKSLLKHILKSIDPKDTSLDNLEEDHLSDRFVDKIQGKSFFLVLDDLDTKNRSDWKNLAALLKKGNNEGSRILVTTRFRKVADVVGSSSDSTYKLRGLSEKDSLELFERHASPKRRDRILLEIVKKCCGVPLALKVIGSLLCGADAVQWENVRDCKSLADIPDESNEGNEVIRILKINYDDLDPTAKQCFSYCALFPKNYLIPKKILSSIWVDNVHFKTNGGETLESVCDKNLRILYNRYFLEAENCKWVEDSLYGVFDEFENATHFKMHDLMFDLAKDVAGEEILLVDPNPEGDNFTVKEKVRHLFLADGSTPTFQSKGKGKRLRSILQCDGDGEMILSWIPSICPALRLLDISNCGIDNLPSSVGKLISLRYLDLSHNGFQTIPDSICGLINLKHLCLRGCISLTHLPSGMGALTSLQVLDMYDCRSLKELPRSIVNMVNLRRLILKNCSSLTHLPSGIDGLTSLQVLDIRNYRRGMLDTDGYENLPSSIGKLINLQHLYLAGSKFQSLPNSICELINLKQLYLDSCIALTQMPSEMGALTSLQVLKIHYCQELEELPSSIVNLVSLSHLCLKSCGSLSDLPSGMDALTSLQLLIISDCWKLNLPSCIGSMVNLRHLTVSSSNYRSGMPFGVGALTSLEVLNLECHNLAKLPRGIQKLNNLRKFSLRSCLSLVRMPSGMGPLLSVCTDPIFIVGHPHSSCAQLEELLPLSDFPEKLKIEIAKHFRLKAPTGDGEAFLLNKESLRKLEITFRPYGYHRFLPSRKCSWNQTEEVPSNHMDILAKLQPPPKLENFTLDGYQCMAFPPWVPQHDFAYALQNLVYLSLQDCNKFRYLPFMRRLKCLEQLVLCHLSSLEYIEENVSAARFCLPRLELLTLKNLPKFKGWCGGVADGANEDDIEHIRLMSVPSFPRLFSVIEGECPNFEEPLHFLLSLDISIFKNRSCFRITVPEILYSESLLLLKENDSLKLTIDCLPARKVTPRYLAETFRLMSDQLTHLRINFCYELKTLPGLQHLTSLQHLTITCCDNFTWEQEEEAENVYHNAYTKLEQSR